MKIILVCFFLILFSTSLKAEFAFWAGFGPPSKLAFSQFASTTATAGVGFTIQPAVAVMDYRSRVLPTATSPVTLTAYSDSSCTSLAAGTLSANSNPVNASAGIAAYTGLQYSEAGTIYLKATSGSIESSCSSGIVVSPAAEPMQLPSNAPIPQKIVVTSPSLPSSAPRAAATNQCIALNLELRNYWEHIALALNNTTLNLNGNGSGTYYSDSGCTTSILTTQIPQYESNVTVYYKNPAAESLVLTFIDQAGIIDSGIYFLSLTSTRLSLIGPQSVLYGGNCVGPYTIEYFNGDGTPISGTINIDGFASGSGGGASSIHSASNCTGGNKITPPVSVNGSYTFYYKTASITSTQLFTASTGSSPPPTASLEVSVNSTVATSLLFSKAPSSIVKSRCTALDVLSNTLIPIETTVTITQSGNVQIYADSNCTISTSTVILDRSSLISTKRFYIKGDTLESLTVTASAPGLTDGTLPLNVINGVNPMVVGGVNYTCTLMGDQRIKCWGNGSAGRLGYGGTSDKLIPTYVSGINTAIKISAMSTHACALLSDQTIKCWGQNTYGQLGNSSTTNASSPVSVSGISTALAVSAGADSSCALLSNQTVNCWGYNANGLLGNNSTTDSPVPVVVSNISTATGIAVGKSHACALLSDQTIMCWGANSSGQLGNNSTSPSLVPVSVVGINNAVAISAGNSFSCALLNDSTVKCWGYNANGELGNNSTASVSSPVNVSGISTANFITSGYNTTCVILSDSTAKCWGRNSRGELGNNNTTFTTIPLAVIDTSNISSMSTGNTHSCAILTDDTMKCWGQNSSGQVGNGASQDYVLSPRMREGTSTVIDVKVALTKGTTRSHACALLSNQTVKCWGDNTSGQIGDGSTSTATSNPVNVSGITTAISLDVGGYANSGPGASCAVLSDNTISCWGENASGQLGNNSTTDSTVPVQVSGITNATDVKVGKQHTCALLSDQTVKCWGVNSSGQLGNNSTTTSLVPVYVSGISTATKIAVSDASSCALLVDQTVKCWGANTFGQLGNNSTTNSLVPVSVSGLSNVTFISGGFHSTCAVLSDGSVYCWGNNTNGQIGNGLVGESALTPSLIPLGTLSATQAVISETHACALISDNTIKCWGSNTYGNLGNGTSNISLFPTTVKNISTATQISIGSGGSCAVLSDQTVHCWGENNSNRLMGWYISTDSVNRVLFPNFVLEIPF